jgi:hypothetical protein
MWSVDIQPTFQEHVCSIVRTEETQEISVKQTACTTWLTFQRTTWCYIREDRVFHTLTG